MQHVVQAALAAQRIVGTAGVVQQAVGQRRGQLAQRVGRCVDHEQAQAVGVQLRRLLEQRFGRFAGGGVETVVMLEEAPGAVAVDDGQLGAAQAGVFRLGYDVGQQRSRIGPIAQIADAYLQRLGRGRCGERVGAGEGDQTDRGMEREWMHGATPEACGQHRKRSTRGEYAESTSRGVPRS
ncbi:hypothetical protein D3C77_508990 [compost metagenome]